MLALQHIQKTFHDKIILNDVAFAVHTGDTIALVGENGSGKTSLLKIIMGEMTPDAGTVMHDHEIIGYLPQEPMLGQTVQESFSNSTHAWRIDYALSLVGLQDLPKASPTSHLSGGQKTRLGLATLLAYDQEPTLLLLDEPTNNLDADGLDWLEHFIRTFTGGVILVSHDRTFINKICNRVFELDNGILREYGGNYDFYKIQKQTEYETQLALYEKTQKETKHLTKAIALQREQGQHIHKHIKRPDNDKAQRDFFRNRVARKFGQQAKALEGRLSQIQHIERPEQRKVYNASLLGKAMANKLILTVNHVDVTYNNATILHDVTITIRGNQHLHIKGANGVGKTTLLKVAAGLLQPTHGERKLGVGVTFGYFSQDADGLDYSQSALANLQTIQANATTLHRQARSLGLTERDLRQTPNRLSRGQRAKLAFAKLLLAQNDLLILDEPTNHLDIPTRETIEQALQAYQGAIIVTSHDNYFVNAIGADQEVTLA